MKNISEEIEELRKMKVPELLERYRELWGKEPRCRNKEHLWRRCAWRLQEIRLGGLSKVAKDKLEELIGEIELPMTERERTVTGPLKRPRKPDAPLVGTVLVREWHGKRLEAKVVEGGYEVNGVVYGTLSEATKDVTGAHWNGKLFWGLSTRKRSK